MKTAVHGPDNPRDWDPNAAILRSPAAPHEVSGVMRAHRAGYGGSELMKLLHLPALKLSAQLSKALDAETAAIRDHRGIHPEYRRH